MSNESEISYSSDQDDIEEKRRKNVLDNQKFLQSLKLYNIRDDLKSTVNSIAKTNKPQRKKHIDQSEIRRSSRIQSMCKINYNNNLTIDDEDMIISTDEVSSEEEDDDLSSAFIAKVDKDWQPLHPEKITTTKATRPVRKAAKIISGGVKIYTPNTGLEASNVISKHSCDKPHVYKRLYVAISSSSEGED